MWCKHNLSHYPKTVSSFFLFVFVVIIVVAVAAYGGGGGGGWCVLFAHTLHSPTHSFALSLLDVSRCGCDLPFTSACITKQL